MAGEVQRWRPGGVIRVKSEEEIPRVVRPFGEDREQMTFVIASSAVGMATLSPQWPSMGSFLNFSRSQLKPMKEGEFAVQVVDHNGRLHSVNGAPALKYSTGEEEFHWHGVQVPEFVARRPEEITTSHIEAEDNAEVRRVMIERYGLQRYMADCGAVKIHTDECGELYKKNMGQGEEPWVFVKVKNSTPEPDGSIKDYFLRVPPRTKTARAGIAWTFNIDPRDYSPELQT